jgi:transposase
MTLAPDQLPNDVAALQAIIARQATELAEQTAALEDAKNQLKARDVPACRSEAPKVGLVMPDLRRDAAADRDVIEQLQLNLDKLKRSHFGQSSEKVQHQIDQLELALEDLRTDRAAKQAEANSDIDDQAEDGNKKDKKKRGRKKLPAHLPRERSVLDPGDTCPDCGGELRLLGEDINELLDFVSAKLKVLQIARLKKSCRRCEKIVQHRQRQSSEAWLAPTFSVTSWSRSSMTTFLCTDKVRYSPGLASTSPAQP